MKPNFDIRIYKRKSQSIKSWIHSQIKWNSPDFPLISFALRLRALTKVSVRMEFDGWYDSDANNSPHLSCYRKYDLNNLWAKIKERKAIKRISIKCYVIKWFWKVKQKVVSLNLKGWIFVVFDGFFLFFIYLAFAGGFNAFQNDGFPVKSTWHSGKNTSPIESSRENRS